jgi:hypothetical protein
MHCSGLDDPLTPDNAQAVTTPSSSLIRFQKNILNTPCQKLDWDGQDG